MAQPRILSVPLVLEFADSILAVTVAVMRLLLSLSLLLEHLKWHRNLAVELMVTILALTVLEVNRRHSMADSLLAMFVDYLNHLYELVVVDIAASNRLHTLAELDHLANGCSGAVYVGIVFGFAVAVAAVAFQSSDRAEYFVSLFEDFDTTSGNIRNQSKREINCQPY